MSTTILIGLVAAVLFAVVMRMFASQPQPPQIIYVQVTPAEPSSPTGCLPLLVLLLVVLAAISLL
jgi:hypothetical protein